jgi:ABC-type transport system substrate-binding protein
MRLHAPLAARVLVAIFLAVPLGAGAADPAKVLHAAFPIAETSFDPAFVSDAASLGVVSYLFDTMLDYDYLVRPVKLVPRALAAMPEVRDGGRTYVCKVQRGIYFIPDPAFKGRARELTAADFAYGFKRILDPKLHSPWLWLLEGKLIGEDAARANAARTGKFDYDAPIAGLEVVDRYTLAIHLKSPDLRFQYVFAVPTMSAQAREVVEAYGADIGAHPVGTGPYRLGEYRRSAKIVLEANPGYRKVTYVPSGPVPAEFQSVADALKGQSLPIAGKIEISIIDENQTRWLAFLNRQLDFIEILPIDFTEQALVDGKLRPELAARGIVHQPLLRPSTWWTYFNMKDPVVGGYSPERIALRRAIGMGFNYGEYIRVLLKGRAAPASGPIPPDIPGYDPAHKTEAQLYDPATARALLDRFGYKDRDGDGYREAPDGSPLVIEQWSAATSFGRQGDELWKRNMDAIGIRMVFRQDKLPELRKMARLGKIPMRRDGWNADYPDGENFMQLLYGPNAGQSNDAQFDLPEYNRLFEQAQALPDSPERTRIFDRMSDLALGYAPWRLGYHLIDDSLRHPWVGNYVPHPIKSQWWEFVDIDLARAGRR